MRNLWYSTIIIPTVFFCLISSPRQLTAQSIGDYSEHWLSGDTMFVRCQQSVVMYFAPKEDILRISYSPDGIPPLEESIAVPGGNWILSGFTLQNYSDSLVFSVGEFSVCASKFPYRHTITVASGAELIQPADGGYSAEGLFRKAKYGVQSSDHYYGFGEKSIPFDRKGYKFRSYNRWTDHYELGESNMNINIPVFFNPVGYGILFDNPYPGYFDMGYTEYDRWSYQADNGIWVEYIFSGSLKDMLSDYHWLTGHQPMPPKWSLGYIQSKYGYETQEEAMSVADTLRLKDFPCDALCLDLYWYETMGDLTWNLEAFPDPQGILDTLAAKGIKLILIEQPYVWQASLNFNTAFSNGYFGETPSGNPLIIPNFWNTSPAGLLDITNPTVQNWWWNLHLPLIGQGVAGWWTDLIEPETHPDSMAHFLGSASRVHNSFSEYWNKNLYERYRQDFPMQRIYNQTRSGYAGIQRYGVMPWSNDANGTFGGLEAQLPIMLGLSMSGIGINHADIGGFWGNINAELYIRWMQFGCFSPIARAHGWRDNNEPWRYGPTAEIICRKYIKWRYRLTPYLYTTCWNYHLTGIPVARPLVLEYPDDAQTIGLSSQYMLGDEIMVCPVVAAGQTNKLIYIPEGGWIDFWNEVSYNTPGWHNVSAPLDDIPVLVKPGAIIPLQTEREYSNQFGQDTLIVRIYPGADGSFDLYEDEGQNYNYENGYYSITQFQTQNTGLAEYLHISAMAGSFSGAPVNRTWFCDFRMTDSCPEAVYANTIPLPQAQDSLSLLTLGSGWYWNQEQSSLLVKKTAPVTMELNFTVSFSDIPGVEDLTISVEGGAVHLNWSPLTGAVRYDIYRSNNPYFFTQIPIGQTAANSYVDTTANMNTGNFYRVVVVY